MIIVAALYKFAPFPNYKEAQADIINQCQNLGIRGTLLLAHEGINGTIAGSREGIDQILAILRALPGFADLEHKESSCNTQPFVRMKVRLKKEIVTSGVPALADPTKDVGTYVDANGWNQLLSDPRTVVIDTRNDYEVDLGTFQKAINPQTKTFRQFPDFVSQLDIDKDRPVAMFCTGGIRCEKASSYMKNQGFSNVYHLKGGILKYLETVAPEQSLWQGECFVFDNRVSVRSQLEVGGYNLCHGCRNPISAADKTSALYEEGVTCPQCAHTRTDAQKRSARERQKQMRLAQERISI